MDDTLIFLKVVKKNCRNLVSLLESYCLASGQGINLQKSSVFFKANILTSVSTKFGDILGMPVVNNSGTYLVMFLPSGGIQRNKDLLM